MFLVYQIHQIPLTIRNIFSTIKRIVTKEIARNYIQIVLKAFGDRNLNKIKWKNKKVFFLSFENDKFENFFYFMFFHFLKLENWTIRTEKVAKNTIGTFDRIFLATMNFFGFHCSHIIIVFDAIRFVWKPKENKKICSIEIQLIFNAMTHSFTYVNNIRMISWNNDTPCGSK